MSEVDDRIVSMALSAATLATGEVISPEAMRAALSAVARKALTPSQSGALSEARLFETMVNALAENNPSEAALSGLKVWIAERVAALAALTPSPTDYVRPAAEIRAEIERLKGRPDSYVRGYEDALNWATTRLDAEIDAALRIALPWAREQALREAAEAARKAFRPTDWTGPWEAQDHMRAAIVEAIEALIPARPSQTETTEQKAKRPPVCDDCGQIRSDPPSKLCPGCQAYKEHQA